MTHKHTSRNAREKPKTRLMRLSRSRRMRTGRRTLNARSDKASLLIKKASKKPRKKLPKTPSKRITFLMQ